MSSEKNVLEAHEAPVEWWYINARLADLDDERYAFALALFKYQLPKLANRFLRFVSPYVFSVHSSVVDIARNEIKSDTKDASSFFLKKTITPSCVQLSSASIFLNSGQLNVKSTAKAFEIVLQGKNKQHVLQHGKNSVISMGNVGSSTYISQRFSAAGALTVNQNSKAVRGSVWLDHQWGSWNTTKAFWNWAACDFEDGSALMLYHFYNNDNQTVSKIITYVSADGVTKQYRNISISYTKVWTSKKTGETYPIKLKVLIHDLQEVISIAAEVEHCEIQSKLASYWEGPTRVECVRGSHKIKGDGYLETVGSYHELYV